MGKLVSAYQLVGLATAVVWIACSVVALSTHPNPRINAVCGLRHNSLTIAQALALPLPLLWSVFSALAAAASHGWDRLKSATYRRLNLGAAAASLWLAAAAARAPAFTTGHDMYPPILKVIAAVVHVITACVCLSAWVRTVDSSPPPVRGHYVPRIVRGLVGSVWRLAPTGVSDDPDAAGGRDGRNEWALAALLFGYFTVLPVVSRFPLATVPAMLGTRLSRAVSGARGPLAPCAKGGCAQSCGRGLMAPARGGDWTFPTRPERAVALQHARRFIGCSWAKGRAFHGVGVGGLGERDVMPVPRAHRGFALNQPLAVPPVGCHGCVL